MKLHSREPHEPHELDGTLDVYFGLDNPTHEEWSEWHRAMLAERDKVRGSAGLIGRATAYDDASTNWSDTTFRQLFLFMYDASFYDNITASYRTNELIERWTAMFGRVDSVLLWHAYPRLGFDSRTQFDFYRDMPGGIEKLRREVCDVFHAHGIRIFLDYNPWDVGTYDELGEMVERLDADGVMLDTMTDAPDRLEQAVRGRRAGVVFAPELRPRLEDLARHRQAWAQWIDMGDAAGGMAERPSILRHRWLLPRHRQLSIRRWDESRYQEIAYSFFNGSGLILWDNIFGSWNPYSREDRKLIAETAAIFDRYQDVFVYGDWEPLIPTGTSGLDANRWTKESVVVTTLRNRTKEKLYYELPQVEKAGAYIAFWGDQNEVSAGDRVVIEPGAVQALVLDDISSGAGARAHFRRLGARADVALPDYETRSPPPIQIQPAPRAGPTTARSAAVMIEIPGGDFVMKLRHERRECGCYPLGAPPADAPMWGWFYKDILTHEMRVSMKRYAMRATAVTNDEFLAFVHGTQYRPDDPQRFLHHIAREADGSLPATLPSEQGALPVTFVSLADARAYAAWCGERLPTEAEWQWAAESAGEGNKWPWGEGKGKERRKQDEARASASELRPAFDPSTKTKQGVMGLSGNAWELTESEHSDGHTRFVMLRGGIFLKASDRESEWLVARGPRPNDYHAKFILLSDGLDRQSTISFRTVG